MDPNTAHSVIVNQDQKKSRFKLGFSPKILYIIFGIVVVIELIFAGRKLLAPVQINKIVPTDTSSVLPKGQLSLTSLSQTYKQGDKITVKVDIFTGGRQVEGADAIIQYDPSILEASNSSVVKGSAFSEYPTLSADQKTGIIQVSGLSGVNSKPFSGLAPMATVTFTAKTKGNTTISFSHTPGNTTDSNITESGNHEDMLDKVFNLNLTIQ